LQVGAGGTRLGEKPLRVGAKRQVRARQVEHGHHRHVGGTRVSAQHERIQHGRHLRRQYR
jgi:hypothetical protein